MSLVIFPQLTFADAYSQPSDTLRGRRFVAGFDSANIYTLLSDNKTFADPTQLITHPVVVQVSGTTIEGPTFENFVFAKAGLSIVGTEHFTSFTGVSVIDGYKIFVSAKYGSVNIKEYLPLSQFDGYAGTFLQTTAYGNGIFIFTDAYGNSYNPGFGQFQFEYAAPFQIPLRRAPEQVFIGNTPDLLHCADGIIDEIKITSATATKTRTRILAGSYDVSIEATSPVFSEPDAKTLVLLHLDDNSQLIIDALRDPLDSANLPDSVLEVIVSLRNDRTAFINYVNSLNITGTIVDGSIDNRALSEQLFDLVTVLNDIINSAQYYKLSGNFFPSEINVNSNFKFAAVFSGENYKIEKSGLINDTNGSIELWIAPLSNLLGDFNRRVYLDSINHAIIGLNGDLFSSTSTLIQLPNNIIAQYINSIRVVGIVGIEAFDFSEQAALSNNGNTIVLNKELPLNNTAVIIDYIPFSTSNDRLTLFKDEDSNLVFSISADASLYHITRDVSSWKKNEWHRVMLTWKANNKNNLNHLNMYVDGDDSEIIKYGEGYLYNTFKFRQEQQITINTKIIPQNIQFIGNLDSLNIGTDFNGLQPGMCRISNLRVSLIERQPIIDVRGVKIDSDFDGGSKSATPVIQDSSTQYLEDFDPNNFFVKNFASLQDSRSGIHDLHIIVRDNFKEVRGVSDGQVERLLRELIKIISPAEARTRISVATVG